MRWKINTECSLRANAFYVAARPRINFDQIAYVNENRGWKFAARLDLDRLGDVGRCVALGARLTVFDL